MAAAHTRSNKNLISSRDGLKLVFLANEGKRKIIPHFCNDLGAVAFEPALAMFNFQMTITDDLEIKWNTVIYQVKNIQSLRKLRNIYPPKRKIQNQNSRHKQAYSFLWKSRFCTTFMDFDEIKYFWLDAPSCSTLSAMKSPPFVQYTPQETSSFFFLKYGVGCGSLQAGMDGSSGEGFVVLLSSLRGRRQNKKHSMEAETGAHIGQRRENSKIEGKMVSRGQRFSNVGRHGWKVVFFPPYREMEILKDGAVLRNAKTRYIDPPRHNLVIFIAWLRRVVSTWIFQWIFDPG